MFVTPLRPHNPPFPHKKWIRGTFYSLGPMCEISRALVGRAVIPAGTYEIGARPPRPIHIEMRGRVHRSLVSPKRASRPLSNTANTTNISTLHLQLQPEDGVPCRPRRRRITSVRHNGGAFISSGCRKSPLIDLGRSGAAMNSSCRPPVF